MRFPQAAARPPGPPAPDPRGWHALFTAARPLATAPRRGTPGIAVKGIHG